MPRGIKGSGAAKKKGSPRRKKGAMLSIQEPKLRLTNPDEERFHRRESFLIAKDLRVGQTVTLDELLADANKLHNYFLGRDQFSVTLDEFPRAISESGNNPLPKTIITDFINAAKVVAHDEAQATAPASSGSESYKGKFAELNM